jgi:carbonic anhydrase
MHHMGESKFDLLEKNRQWVKEQLELDPNYFNNLSLGQNPEYLWI